MARVRPALLPGPLASRLLRIGDEFPIDFHAIAIAQLSIE